MTEAGAKSRWRTFRIVLLLLALAGAITFAGLSWYVTTEVFHSRVRQRLIGALEKITGGRVELGSIHAIPFQLRVEVRDLTIHGREDQNYFCAWGRIWLPFCGSRPSDHSHCGLSRWQHESTCFAGTEIRKESSGATVRLVHQPPQRAARHIVLER